MYYKQLKDFFRQREQKAFWIFNYANIVGLFLGFFTARSLSEAVPWLPAPLLFPMAMLGGLALTWQRQGREAYRTGWLLCRYTLRRLFSKHSLMMNSANDYRVEQTTIRPFAVAGRLIYSGEEPTSRREHSTPVKSSLLPVGVAGTTPNSKPGGELQLVEASGSGMEKGKAV